MGRRRWHRRGDGRDRGETLLELIVAITILGVCVVAIGSGIAMSITVSALHRNQANAQAALHNYAETLPGLYQPCTAPVLPLTYYAQQLSQLAPPGFAPPKVLAVLYWNPVAGSFYQGSGCPNGTDYGLEQVTLQLVSTSKTVSESLVVDLRSGS